MSDRSSPLSDVPHDVDGPIPKRVTIKTEVDDAPKAKVKTEDEERPSTPEPTTSAAAEVAEASEPRTPVTPKTPKRAASDDVETESPMKRTKGRASPKAATTPRQRKAPVKTPSSARSIATSMDELSAEDRLLLNMKDQGKSWKEIGEAWKAATGVAPAKSTLPNRYARLRANITSMSDVDQQNLAAAKAMVEQAFEAKKWEQIAEKMTELGSAERFSTNVLQKQFSKMEAAKAQAPVNPFEDVEE